MELKHLIVHLDSSERTAERLELAVSLAARFGARLSGLFAEGASIGGSAVGRRSPQNMQRAREEARARFEQRTREASLATDWWQVEQGDYAHLVGWTAVCCRYADLALFGQQDPEREGLVPPDLVDQAVLESGRPVLVVPYIGRYTEIGSRVLVAWTGSRESARALNDALPLLRGAREVTVLSLQQAPSGAAGTVPDLDITAHLRAHGVEASYERVLTDTGAADLVLNRAADTGADLTVLGAYTQSGFPFLPRSTTTRDILRTMTTPVLLSR